MKRLLREPLLHFLILGAGIFVLFSAVGDVRDEKSDRIIVSAKKIENLAKLWKRTWQRPPTQQELEGLIEDHIKEEVLYREALALGLNQDDTIIRRRLRQKMEFLVEDVVAEADPTNGELQVFMEKNPTVFRVQGRVSFSHIYLSRDRRGASVHRDAERLLRELGNGNGRVDPPKLGDPFLLPHKYQSLSETEIVKLFGQEFGARVLDLELGRWTGPVESGYGVHLVHVRERTEGHLPKLADVREAVRREWLADRRRGANAAYLRRLRDKYTVIVERPQRSGGDLKTAKAR